MAGDPECREVVELASGYLEGAMAPADRQRLEDHLALCDGCEHHLEQLRALIRVAGRPVVEAVPPETMAGLLRAFRDWRR